jgi:predicted RNA polymerase sigma factor
MTYEVERLGTDDQARLERAYDDLLRLASDCEVPAVRANARAALALVAQALNGQGLRYGHYSKKLAKL